MIATINGTSIHYEQQGEGPAILFIHGLGGTSNVWHAQRVGLSRYYKVIAYDLTGSGLSDKSKKEYSIATWADEAAGLLDHLKIEQAVIVGHSMATVIAQHFAAKHPQKTAALVLCGGLVELGPPGKEAFTKRADTVEKEGMIAIADAVLGGALTAATREANPALTGLVRELLLSNCPQSYAGHCRALVAASAKADQSKISAPTLLLVGDQDPVTPLALQKTIAGAIKNSRIRVVPNTAHLTMLETPAAFNTALLEFLGSI
ncbi:MAG: alpha/beta fold hydrolase, partial [Gemmataceae bacterium]